MGGCQVSHRDLPSVLDHTEGKKEVHRNSHLSQKHTAVYGRKTRLSLSLSLMLVIKRSFQCVAYTFAPASARNRCGGAFPLLESGNIWR